MYCAPGERFFTITSNRNSTFLTRIPFSWDVIKSCICFHWFGAEIGGASKITEACDWWSLGALLYELLTGTVSGSFYSWLKMNKPKPMNDRKLFKFLDECPLLFMLVSVLSYTQRVPKNLLLQLQMHKHLLDRVERRPSSSFVRLCFSSAPVAVPPYRRSPSYSAPYPRVPQHCSRLASHWGNRMNKAWVFTGQHWVCWIL